MPKGTLKDDSNSATAGTIDKHPIVPPGNCNSATTAPPIVPPGIQEGNPLKVIQIRNSTSVPLPFNSDSFQSAWQDWIQFRKEAKKKLTEITIDRQFKMLKKLGEERAIQSIEASIQNGWTGLFEPKEQKPASRPTNEKLKYQLNGHNVRPFD